MGWIGTVEVNPDMGLEPGETQRQNVSPGSSLASRSTLSDGTLVLPYCFCPIDLPNNGCVSLSRPTWAANLAYLSTSSQEKMTTWKILVAEISVINPKKNFF